MLLILCLLIWLLILLYYITNKGFIILLIWLVIGPMVLNFISQPNQNPFFTPEIDLGYTDQLLLEKAQEGKKHSPYTRYMNYKTSIRVDELLDPTRLLFIFFVLVLLMDKYYKKAPLEPFNITEILMVVFSVFLVVNIFLLSSRLANSLKIAIDAFFVPFAAYYITRRFVNSEERLRQLTNVLIAFGLMLIVIAIIERTNHSTLLYRLRGPFPHRNHFYIVLMAVFFMTLLYTARYHWGRSKPLTFHALCCWVILCVVPMLILATWTRSNWLGFFSALWVTLFFARQFITRGHKMAMIGLSLLLIPLLIIAFQAIPDEVVDTRIANDNTIYARIGAWIVQVEVGLKHPILGIGFNNVRELLVANRIYFMGIQSLVSSHNCFLALGVELGLCGLALYFAVIISIIRAGVRQFRRPVRREDKWLGIVSAAMLVGHLVPGLTSVILFTPYISHAYVYTCLGALAGVAGKTQVPVVRIRSFKPDRIPRRVRR